MAIQSVDAKTLNNWLEHNEAVLVDVREPAEFASESIPGATLVPLSTVKISTLPPHEGKKLVIYCRKGGRGGSACQKLLAEMPNLDLYNLTGGIEAWMAAQMPVTRSGRKVLPLDRQVQLAIGTLVLVGVLLGFFVNPAYFLLSGFFGVGLIIAGLSGFCGMARIMTLMPWNR
jgi:rhodanese-related sulfurtransferase